MCPVLHPEEANYYPPDADALKWTRNDIRDTGQLFRLTELVTYTDNNEDIHAAVVVSRSSGILDREPRIYAIQLMNDMNVVMTDTNHISKAIMKDVRKTITSQLSYDNVLDNRNVDSLVHDDSTDLSADNSENNRTISTCRLDQRTTRN